MLRNLRERIAAVPGVRSASLATIVPLSIGGGSDMSPRIEGYEPADHEELTVYYGMVSPGYFDTLGIPVVSGRALDDRDTSNAALAVVINQAMASRYWKGGQAVGGRIDYGGGWATVVGIAKTGKYFTLGEAPKNMMYLPLAQVYRPNPTLVAATSGDPAAVLPSLRRAVAEVDPNLPLFDVRTLDEHLRASVFLPRLAFTLLGAFGTLALLLAVVGLYGVIAYSVARRTREIGVRMALGAERGTIRREVLRDGMRLAAVGLAIGLGLAVLAAPLVASQLVGLPPLDLPTFAVTAVGLLFVTALATWLPAWRASQVNPIDALRVD